MDELITRAQNLLQAAHGRGHLTLDLKDGKIVAKSGEVEAEGKTPSLAVAALGQKLAATRREQIAKEIERLQQEMEAIPLYEAVFAHALEGKKADGSPL